MEYTLHPEADKATTARGCEVGPMRLGGRGRAVAKFRSRWHWPGSGTPLLEVRVRVNLVWSRCVDMHPTPDPRSSSVAPRDATARAFTDVTAVTDVTDDIALGRVRLAPGDHVPWPDSLALFGLTLIWLRLLRQRALHGLDVPDFINWLQLGKASHHIHYLFMPVVDAMHRALRPLGFTPHETLLLASNLGGALGVFALHRAGVRLGLGRVDALVAALLVAATPAVTFFGTVAEIHAVFFAFAGVACWQWARFLARPRAGAVCLLGATTALAAAVHATGHLLVVMLLALTVGLLGRRAAPLWRLALLGVVVHGVASVGLDASLRPIDVDVQRTGVIGFLWRCLAQLPVGWNILADVWREWLRPFLPLSVVPIAALGRHRTRRFACGWWVTALVFFAITVVLLFGKLVERGAYHLPLAWPAALLVLALLPRAWQVVMLLLAVALSTFDVFAHDHPHENPRLVADLRAAAEQEKLFVLCADDAEYQPLLRDLPSVASCPLMWIGQMVVEGYDAFATHLDTLLDQQIAAGYSVLISERAFAWLSAVPEPTVARYMREHLPARYDVEPFQAGEFRAVRLRRKP